MSDHVELDWSQTGKKWVSYFDILGFSRFVCERDPLSVFCTYSMCLEEFRRHEESHKKWGGLQFIHFSDSFLIFAPDDSAGSFAAIESPSRWFFNFLLQREIPVSGAMACDEFYADRANGIFFGKALVEASKLSESLNWIGFVLCPSAIGKLSDVGLPADGRLHYRKWNAPVKGKSGVCSLEPTFAYLINHTMNDKNIFVPLLERMAARIEDPKIKMKYENTLSFLKHFGVAQPVKAAS